MNTNRNEELTQLLHTSLKDGDTAKPKLLDFIREELEEFIHKDMIESASSVIIGDRPPNGYPLEDLQNKLLEIAKDRGVEAAVSAFDRYTTDTQASFQYWALLEGISVGEKIQIFDGVKLVPPPDSLLELSQLFNFSLYEWRSNSLSEKGLLVIDASVSPVFHKPDLRGSYTGADFLFKEDSGKFPNFNESTVYNDDFYTDLCQALSLACNSAVQILLQWRFVKKDEIFNLTPGPAEITQLGGGDLSESFAEVKNCHIEEAKRIYDEFAKFNPSDKEKLLIVIDRWIKSKTSQAAIDSMIDLGIALESLYVPDSSGEITFKLGVRAALHLRDDLVNRKALKKKFGEIYSWRSTAVHTGELTQKTKNLSQKEVKDFIETAQDHCRDSILKILKEGKFPTNWDDLIFG